MANAGVLTNQVFETLEEAKTKEVLGLKTDALNLYHNTVETLLELKVLDDSNLELYESLLQNVETLIKDLESKTIDANLETQEYETPSESENAEFSYQIVLSLRKVNSFEVCGQDVKELNDGNSPIRVLVPLGNGNLDALLQLNSETVYPLNNNIPCLMYGSNIFLFPLFQEGQYYSVRFPDGINEIFIKRFQEIISTYCQLQKFEEHDKVLDHKDDNQIVESTVWDKVVSVPSYLYNMSSDDVANWIQSSGKYVGSNLTSGATYVATYVESHSDTLSDSIQKPEKEVVVPPSITEPLKVASTVSGTVVTVSSGLVSGVGFISNKISNFVASQVGSKSMDVVVSSSQFKSVSKVGFSGLQALSHIWEGLMEAGRQISDSIEKATVKIVHKKYGKNVAQTTSESFKVSKDIATSVIRIKSLGVYGFIRYTGQNVVRDLVLKNNSDVEKKSLET